MFASIKAVVFDFDGVIVESLEVKDRAFFRLYEPFGHEIAESALAYHMKNKGLTRYKKIVACHERLLGVSLDEAGLEEQAKRFSELVEEGVVAAKAVPGSEALLKWLRDRGYPRFVASATPHDELGRIVEARGIADLFDGVFGYPTTKVDVLRRAAAGLGAGMTTKQVLMVGDSMVDHAAALEAGASFVGRYVRHVDEFPLGTVVVNDLSGLLRLFQGGAR